MNIVFRLEELATVRQCAELVSSSVKAKQLHKMTKWDGFGQLLRRLRVGLASDEQSDRALALATLGKVATVVRGSRHEVSDVLLDLRSQSAPDILSLGNPDDRYYAATFWRFVSPPWTGDLLARACVEEESAEKFRRECLDGLIQYDHDVASALQRLVPYVKQLSFSTESPSDSKGRRLRRLFAGLRDVLSSTMSVPGRDSGSELRELLLVAFRSGGAPTASRDELAEEAVSLIHDFVRSQFSLSTWPQIYAALRTVKDWYQGADWEEFIRASPGGRALSRDIESALEILARAGTPDNLLFEYFSLTVGASREARTRAEAIVQRNPGLSEEVSSWLSGRAVRRKSTLAAESQYQQADELIADLIAQQQTMSSSTEQLNRDVFPRLRIMDERGGAATSIWLGQFRALGAIIESLATMRGLSLVGSIGDLVEYSPLEHELADPARFGARTVRLMRPMVVARTADNLRRVVRKALVEPI